MTKRYTSNILALGISLIFTIAAVLPGCDDGSPNTITHWSATIACYDQIKPVVDEAQSSVISLCYDTSSPAFCDDLETMFVFNFPSPLQACAVNSVVWSDRELHEQWQYEIVTSPFITKNDGDRGLTVDEATLACQQAADFVCGVGANDIRDACYGSYWTEQYDEAQCELVKSEFESACSSSLIRRGTALQMCNVAMQELANR